VFKNNKSPEISKNPNKDTSHGKSKIAWKKIVLSVTLILCIILIGFITVINKYIGKVNKVDINKNDLSIKENFLETETSSLQNNEMATSQNKDIQNIALFGIDEPEGTAGRSDCILIFTIDNKHNKLKLSSITRDAYVTIPTRDKKDKINHAYAFGGPQLALKTLNANFNLNIDKFITVNFSSLPKIIDDIGGIELDINADEIEYLNHFTGDSNDLNGTNSPNITTSGSQKIDGTQALAYCRIRETEGGDFERSQRHRTVINKLIEQCNTIPVTRYPSLLNQLLPLVHTNLETSDILSLSMSLSFLRNQPLLQERFPRDDDSDGHLIDGIYYYVFNEESTIKKIHEFIFE